jgi:hypothetical protein
MKIARGCQLNFAFGSIARVRMQQELYEAFMIGSFFKRRISTEACLRRHRHFRAAYKIEACVVPGESKFLCDGHSVSYSRAAIFLCIKNSIGDIDRVRAWESAEHKVSNDAEKVLASECQRLSKLIGKRIELIWFDKDKNEYFVREVFNPNDSQYWLEETNL